MRGIPTEAGHLLLRGDELIAVFNLRPIPTSVVHAWPIRRPEDVEINHQWQ